MKGGFLGLLIRGSQVQVLKGEPTKCVKALYLSMIQGFFFCQLTNN